MLGAVLADPAGQQHVLDLVEPADLYRPWHVQVLAAMRRVQKGGGLPGPAEVYAELRRDPDLPTSVSADAVPLADLMEASPRPGHASAYAAIVVESGIRLRLELTGSRLAQAAESGDLDLVRQQAARARREFKASRARWRALPERLRRELPILSPNDHAAATMIRRASAAGARADRGRQGSAAESGPVPEGRNAQVHQHPAPSADDADVQEQEHRCRSPSARSQAAVAEALGIRALRDLVAGPSQIAHVRPWLRQEHFALRSDGALYGLMCDMDTAGMAIDPVTISWQAARRRLGVEPNRLAGGNAALAVPSAREVHRHGLLAEAAQAGRDIQAGTADQRHPLHLLLRSASERLPALEGKQQAVAASRQAETPEALRLRPVSARSRRPGKAAAS
jgi:hypothetical protein